MKKYYSVIYLLNILVQINLLISQDIVKGGFSNCTIYIINNKNGTIDTNSKEIFKNIFYNNRGFKVEENFYWQGKLSYTNHYFYDSLNKIIQNVRKSDYNNNNYTIRHHYDEKGNNTKIYCYSKDNTAFGNREIEYDSNGKETKHIYYSFGDSVNVIEFFNYNEKGLLVKKTISSYRDVIMDTYENYIYDSNDVLIRISIERVPELVSRKDLFHWVKEEVGYVLHGEIPLPPFEKEILFYYEDNSRLTTKKIYYGKYASIGCHDYLYDEFGNLVREIISSDFTTIKKLFESQGLGYIYEELAPYHFKTETGEPRQVIIYNYTK
jgi:hypothetical protein